MRRNAAYAVHLQQLMEESRLEMEIEAEEARLEAAVRVPVGSIDPRDTQDGLIICASQIEAEEARLAVLAARESERAEAEAKEKAAAAGRARDVAVTAAAAAAAGAEYPGLSPPAGVAVAGGSSRLAEFRDAVEGSTRSLPASITNDQGADCLGGSDRDSVMPEPVGYPDARSFGLRPAAKW